MCFIVQTKILVLAGLTGSGKDRVREILIPTPTRFEAEPCACVKHEIQAEAEPCACVFKICILWDEVEALLSAQSRKLFQCSSLLRRARVFAHWQQPCRTSTKSTFTVMWTVLERLLQRSPSRKCRCCRTRGGTGGGGRAATAPNGWGAGDTSRRAAPASETSVSSSQSPAPDTVAKAAYRCLLRFVPNPTPNPVPCFLAPRQSPGRQPPITCAERRPDLRMFPTTCALILFPSLPWPGSMARSTAASSRSPACRPGGVSLRRGAPRRRVLFARICSCNQFVCELHARAFRPHNLFVGLFAQLRPTHLMYSKQATQQCGSLPT